MLLGISGGITTGYFLFHYQAYDPQFVLLTRNTFDPFQALLERMGVAQTILQTTSEKKALSNLLGILEDGRPAIVFADYTLLDYNAINKDPGYWAMHPIVVYGHDGGQAYIADRSSQPLSVSAEMLAAARGRVKKEKYRVIALEAPVAEKLPSAVQQGIWDCIRLFTEAPPHGTRKNFGLSALEHWANMLTNTRNPQGWARYFPDGRGLFSALAGSGVFPGMYEWIGGWGDGGAERGRYADFLEEAAALLDKPVLRIAAEKFRKSHGAWIELRALCLPDQVPLFAEAKQLLNQRYTAFIEEGRVARDRILDINARLKALLDEAGRHFPLTVAETTRFREDMSKQLLVIRELEVEAVKAMKTAID
jgi:hypothetical protein